MKDENFRWRLRLFAVSAGLTALAFVQSPGLVVNDTKFDLAVRPGLFIDKVLHLWDPIGEFGQVQNQAYGYLFPMGPFFALGHELNAPAWVVQRAWWALILVVAFLGVVKLCQLLDVGSPWARVLAGVVFALSPRMLTNLGPISIESWPSAVAPWVLIPLVVGAQRGSARQAAARSGLAAAAVGGVNAVASAAIVPISALWLLTRSRGSRRSIMMRWWPLFVAMATLWWLVPLLVLGRYSPPFLDYIESSTGTTVTGTLADALRGTTKWVPYVGTDYSAGRTLLAQPMAILQTGLLVIFGLLGIVRRDLPERRFLILSLLTGVLLVTMGHRGAFEGFFSLDLNHLLDGVLAPLRNTHKWDVLIRLPLVIGLAHFVSVVGTKVVGDRREKDEGQTVLRVGVSTLAFAAFIGAASVAFSVSLASAGSFEKTPKYWEQAASWLENHNDGRRTYVAPGSTFGDFTWGRPMDEAVQALVDAPWATRSAIPLVPGANIRMMDAIEAELVNGTGSAALHDYLSRAGIGYVLVRNDLRPSDTTPNPTLVHAAINGTPGLVRVASFGPEVGGESRLDDGKSSAVFVNDGHQSFRPAIEVYRVAPTAGESESSTYTTADLPIFVGDSSSLLSALGLEAMAQGPVIFARDFSTKDRPTSVVLTDGSRRQEADFGRVRDNRSASLSKDEPWRTSRVVHDYDTGTPDSQLTVPRLRGASAITATSSSSDAGYPRIIDQSTQPFSAFDRDPDTSWVSGLAVKGRHQLKLELESPTQVDSVQLSVPYVPGARTRSIRVTTSAGTVTTEIAPGDTKIIQTKPGMTTFVAVEARSNLPQPLRISELAVPGIRVSRPLVVPTLPTAWGTPDTVLLSVGSGGRSGCVVVDGDQRCAEGVERLGEDGRTIHRIVTMPNIATYKANLQVQPWGRKQLTALIQQARSTKVAASSQATDQAMSGAFAAVDRNPATGWIASGDDRDPTLAVRWETPQEISGIQVSTSPGLVAATATALVIDFGNGQSRSVTLRDGRAAFDPVTASRATVRFVKHDKATTLSLDGQTGRALPVGVSELTFTGAPLDSRPLSIAEPDRACGSGPDIRLDGIVTETRLHASPAQLYQGDTVSAEPCEATDLRLNSGENDVRVSPTASVRPVALELSDSKLRSSVPVQAEATPTTHSNAASTHVKTAKDAKLLVVRVNSNEGWEADAGSAQLKPIVVDGWQQGWIMPDRGASAVSLHFAPDTTYRAGLAAGIAGILLTVLAAVHPKFGRRHHLIPPVRPVRIGWIPATAAVGLVAGLVGGWSGLVVWCLGWALGSVIALAGQRRGANWDGAPLAVLGLATVYVAYALRPWGGELTWMGREAWPQLVTLAALSVLLAGAFMPEVSRRAKRIPGRSTK